VPLGLLLESLELLLGLSVVLSVACLLLLEELVKRQVGYSRVLVATRRTKSKMLVTPAPLLWDLLPVPL
jgi:hypothetical protein